MLKTFTVVLALVLVLCAALIGYASTRIVKIEKGKYAVIWFNRSNRLFITGLFTFLFGVCMLLASPGVMDFVKIIFGKHPLTCMTSYMIIVNSFILLYGAAVYNVIGLACSVRSDALRKTVRKMNKRSRRGVRR